MLIVFPFLLTACPSDESFEAQDIDKINGAPEFYDITWDMSIDEVKLKFDASYDADNNYLYATKSFDVYGMPCKSALCGYNNEKLDYFSKG